MMSEPFLLSRALLQFDSDDDAIRSGDVRDFGVNVDEMMLFDRASGARL
ncbi:MAG: hypothetical protein AAF281_14630 [Pseudomonadota bacterium]